MPPAMYWTYFVHLGFNIGWLILWDREDMIAALVVIFLFSATLIVCQIISYRALTKYEGALRENNLTKEVRNEMLINLTEINDVQE